MENNDSVLDITNFNIDLALERRQRNLDVLKEMKNYNKVKVKNINIELNYISAKKLDCKKILQAITR